MMKVGTFIPLKRTSEMCENGLNTFEHGKNNEWFSRVWGYTKSGGFFINSKFTLMKDEGRGGWIVHSVN